MRKPKYSLHKKSGQARVIVHGKHVYLGKYNSPESLIAYERICVELESQAPQLSDITMARLCVLFMQHAETYYRKPDGTPTNEAKNLRSALRHVVAEFSSLPVRHFGPKKLSQVREAMIRSGLARKTINASVRRIRHVIKWGVSQELVSPSVLESLRTLEALKAGRTEARETYGKSAVDIERVEAVRPFLTRPVRALVDFMLLTGCRPSEAVRARWSEIDTTGEVWEYRPTEHKTKHKGKGRIIKVGPRAQQVLNGVRELGRTDFVFDPQSGVDATAQQERGPQAVGQCVGKAYSPESLRNAVMAACEKAFECPPELRMRNLTKRKRETDRQLKARKDRAKQWREEHCWTPGQLRHTKATEVRRHSDLETAQQILGHSSKQTTERYYAEMDFSRAAENALRFG